MNKKIEAIIVCKNYSKFLEITLPLNKKHFDNIIVATSEDDFKTQEICTRENIYYGFYKDFNKNGATFNFGGARQAAIPSLKYHDWLCYLDADIILPDNFRELFDVNAANINRFYGSYRRFITKLSDYKSLLKGEKKLEEFEKIEGSGVGYFQLINLNSNVCKYYNYNLYPDSYNSENVDIEFLRKFCPFIEHDGNLVRMDIELLHLGNYNSDHNKENNSFFES